MVFKDRSANTVSASHALYDKMDELKAAYPGLRFDVTFEQSSFIEESISGVTREGVLGAFFAVVAILHLPQRLDRRAATGRPGAAPWSPASASRCRCSWPLPCSPGCRRPPTWCSTPLATPRRHPAAGRPRALIQRLFPTSYTLNIITLSGMTVAVGRVVDDSIVVQENIYRHIQSGEDLRQSVLTGVREVVDPHPGLHRDHRHRLPARRPGRRHRRPVLPALRRHRGLCPGVQLPDRRHGCAPARPTCSSARRTCPRPKRPPCSAGTPGR